MGEYEPEDSRDVTLKPGHEPGGIKRTGPQEDEARRTASGEPDHAPRDQQKHPPVRKGDMMDQAKQQSAQSQSQGSQSQSQSQGQSQGPSSAAQDGEPRPQASAGLNNDIETGPLAGNQPQAKDNHVGAAKPTYDQYEVNSPTNMHQDAADEDRRRAQAAAQNDSSLDKGLGRDRSADASDRIEEDEEERGYGGATEERVEKLKE
ncbi:hypothetical protein [Aurantiacibacter spongiae]|uniref:Uncharacterized protein n=1 Tax=Aurantiacibacter spongiae TaxID=2488860 RepID=A0A3N5CRB8_9SPHN|nr:hypothetical protein [Aurantiacibacter spongiae]RPF71624.1 hypothetical protein EG799_08320 [Aurantiacibacter spongiae]